MAIFFAISGISLAAAGEKPLNNPPEVTEWFRKSATIKPEAFERLLIEIQQLQQSFETPYRPLTEADKEWMKLARTTPEARKRLGNQFRSCCDHGDRVKTKFRIDASTGADTWQYLDPATRDWIDIPADVIHNGDDDPEVPPMPKALSVEGVLFVYKGWPNTKKITCFWPPKGGG